MKEIGIARRVDDLGRIVIPAELRHLFGISPGDAIDVAVDGDAIVLRKVDRACVFCDGVNNLQTFRGRAVCAECAKALASDPSGQPQREVVHTALGNTQPGGNLRDNLPPAGSTS